MLKIVNLKFSTEVLRNEHTHNIQNIGRRWSSVAWRHITRAQHVASGTRRLLRVPQKNQLLTLMIRH